MSGDIPDDENKAEEVYEMDTDNIDNEFYEEDEQELAAAIERHEKQERNLSSVQVYDLNQRLDFTDEELPNAEDIIPMDLSEPKVFGEEDYNAFVQSAELF